jgi:hypothetical protein
MHFDSLEILAHRLPVADGLSLLYVFPTDLAVCLYRRESLAVELASIPSASLTSRAFIRHGISRPAQ